MDYVQMVIDWECARLCQFLIDKVQPGEEEI